ncbi:MAG: DUF899 family protein [Stappiaceae bacterium]
MTVLHDKRFPGENEDYRTARNALLREELALDEQVQKVAQLRRALPAGGKIQQDYVFEEVQPDHGKSVHMSDLFAPGKDTLFLYSFMYGPDSEAVCPSCTSLVDGFSGVSHHLKDRINMAVIAKAPVEKLQKLANSRNWSGIRLLSSFGNSYNEDYFAVGASGGQIPAANIFTKGDDGIRHFWSAELLYVSRPGHPHHVDQIWPIWNILDLTPDGRGSDWEPRLVY